jgi:UDP-glucose 4-epimerase
MSSDPAPLPHFLVTGGAGFIGSHLVEALLARGNQVTVLDDLSTGRLPNVGDLYTHERFRFVQGSILDELMVDELMHSADGVVHLAAAVGVKLIVANPLRSFITNLRGTEIVLEAAHRYRRPILLASTSEIYGKNECDGLTETSDRIFGAPSVARWSYATSKAADEVLAFAYHKERGLPITIARFFNTVGPRQSAAYGMVIPTLVDQALDGEPLTVHGDGLQRRCFCHVADLVAAVLLLLDEPAANGEVFNIGASQEITMLDLAHEIVRRTGSASEVQLISYEEAFESGFEDMRRRVPDVGKLTALTGWTPTRSLENILDETIDHARAEHLVRSLAGQVVH